MQRPAETGGVAAALAYVVAYVLGAGDNPTLLLALGLVIGFVPAAITWAVVTFRKPKP